VGALQLLCLGILGEYVGRMYTMMQGRPSYFVAYDSLNDTGEPFDAGEPAERSDAAGPAERIDAGEPGERNEPGAASGVGEQSRAD
jgi:polyisoprenyl-phosphate glycosyltransferase